MNPAGAQAGDPLVAALPSLATVTVTYHPDAAALRCQLGRLPADCLKVVVDNASSPQARAEIAGVLARFEHTVLLQNEHNRGLAAALNQGVAAAARQVPRPQQVLLLDQDSEPDESCIALLREGYAQLARAGVPVGCVGPTLFDPGTGMNHGFHLADGIWWRRIQPQAGAQAAVPCSNLNGSGTLMPIELFLELGGLDEELFIDHVDTDWSFRVLAHGRLLFGIPAARFVHRMGAGSRRIWLLGWRVWPDRTPGRHRFLFRNTVILMRRPYVPGVWKFWALVRMPLTMVMVLLFGPQRWAQWGAMAAGLAAGLRQGSAREPAR